MSMWQRLTKPRLSWSELMARRVRLECLPLELLKIIVRKTVGSLAPNVLDEYNIPRLRHAYNLCRCNSHLLEIFRSNIDSVNLDFYDGDGCPITFARLFGSFIKNLQVRLHSLPVEEVEDFLETLVCHNPSIESLTVDGFKKDAVGDSLRNSLISVVEASMMSLRIVTISESFFRKFDILRINLFLRNVNILYLGDVTFETKGDFFMFLSGAGGNLRELYLRDIQLEQLSDFSLTQVFSCCPELMTFHMNSVTGCSLYSIRDVPLTLRRNLVHLDCGGIFHNTPVDSSLSPKELSAALETCKQLKHVSAQLNADTIWDTIASLSADGDFVQSLRLSHFEPPELMKVRDIRDLANTLVHIRELRLHCEGGPIVWELCRALGPHLISFTLIYEDVQESMNADFAAIAHCEKLRKLCIEFDAAASDGAPTVKAFSTMLNGIGNTLEDFFLLRFGDSEDGVWRNGEPYEFFQIIQPEEPPPIPLLEDSSFAYSSKVLESLTTYCEKLKCVHINDLERRPYDNYRFKIAQAVRSFRRKFPDATITGYRSENFWNLNKPSILVTEPQIIYQWP